MLLPQRPPLDPSMYGSTQTLQGASLRRRPQSWPKNLKLVSVAYLSENLWFFVHLSMCVNVHWCTPLSCIPSLSLVFLILKARGKDIGKETESGMSCQWHPFVHHLFVCLFFFADGPTEVTSKNPNCGMCV